MESNHAGAARGDDFKTQTSVKENSAVSQTSLEGSASAGQSFTISEDIILKAVSTARYKSEAEYTNAKFGAAVVEKIDLMWKTKRDGLGSKQQEIVPFFAPMSYCEKKL